MDPAYHRDMSNPDSAPKILQADELRSVLLRWCVPPAVHCCVTLQDKAYQVQDDNRTAEFMLQLPLQTRKILQAWKADRQACRKLSLMNMATGQVSHALISEQPATPDIGYAIGQVTYVPDGSSPDCSRNVNIVASCVMQHQEMRVRCFDPQTGAELELSRNERASVSLIFL